MNLTESVAQKARESLELQGYTHIQGVLAPDLVSVLARRVECLFESPHVRSRQVLYTHSEVPQGTPHLDQLLHQWLNPHRFTDGLGTADLLEGINVLIAQLLQAEPVLFQDLLLVKERGQKRFPWHQDYPFWPVDRPHGLVCWIPLVESTLSAGGLTFAAGSHRLGVQPVVDLHRGVPQDRTANMPGLEDGAWELECPPVQAGDALIFSPLVFHSSPPRSMEGRRAAWSSVWLHPEVRWSHTNAPTHPLCREVVDGELVHTL